MKQKQILYFFPYGSAFIRKDIEIFSKNFTCKKQGFEAGEKWRMPFLFTRQFFFLVSNIFSTSLIVCRFGGFHSLLPVLFAKIFGKASLLIIGGTEAHYFPSVGYGNQNKFFYGLATRFSLKHASHISPVDESLVLSDYKYDPAGDPKQGYKNLYPEIRTPYTTIHNGYDADKFFIKRSNRTPNSFLTVAITIEGRMSAIKGIDLILDMATKFPESFFTIIAHKPKHQKQEPPPNVLFQVPVPNEKLVDIYNEHEFYLQLSMAEGFPNSLCEAMLCGCIPIGSGVFGIPKIIGDTGFILMKKDPTVLESLIRTALNCDKKRFSIKARERIKNNYPLERREKELVKLASDLISKN